MRYRPLLSVIVIVGASLLPLLILELALRLFPVSTSTGATVLDDRNPVFRYAPNQPYVFSEGWRFEIVNTGRINNYGFVNEQDYAKHAENGPVVIIGDSYVEAFMVPYQQTVQGRLSRLLTHNRLVYSIGVSGAQLADYLAYAEFARNEFHPCAMVFIVVGNDFDESLAKYKAGPGYHFEQVASTSDFRLVRTDYRPSPWKNMIRYSALARYLWKTVGIGHISEVVQQKLDTSGRYVGNTAATGSQERLTDSQRAVDYFFRELSQRAGIPKSRILFVVDGVRPEVYSGSDEGSEGSSYFHIMRRYFLTEAARQGYEDIDMHPRFSARHRRDGTKFEFAIDGHWNGFGHEEAAKAIASSRTFQEIVTQ
jgi:hypothetical protein